MVTRMIGPDCAVMCKLINTHTRTHIQQELSFHMRHHLCRQEVALKNTYSSVRKA